MSGVSSGLGKVGDGRWRKEMDREWKPASRPVGNANTRRADEKDKMKFQVIGGR